MIVLFGLVLSAAPAMALTVKDVRIGLHPDKTRIVVDLSEMSKFRTFVLADPYRLVIDFPAFDWQVGKISNPKASSVASVRQGALQPGISRIVVDLKDPVVIKSAFLLRAGKGSSDRLVLDFSRTTAEQFARDKGRIHGLLQVDETPVASAAARSQNYSNAAPPAATTPPPQETSRAVPAAIGSGMALPGRKPVTAPPAAKRKYVIIIDPGHGGVDPGALGANGAFEKHVTLALGKELKRQLESTGRYEVHLTRDRDIYLRLYQRVDIARKSNADLFISLHADSIGKPSVHGASVYTLSEKASDSQTAKLAERENKADIIAGTDLSHEDQQVANILIDLAMRDTMNQSKFFANTVVDTMQGNGLKTLESPHRFAGFAVLKAPDVPSVLIETGFMSNKKEAQLLSSAEYRAKIARAIAAGIDAYFDKVGRNNRI